MKLYAVTLGRNDHLSKKFDCLYISSEKNLYKEVSSYLSNERYEGEFCFYEFEVDEEMCANVFTCFLNGDSDEDWSVNIKFTLYTILNKQKITNKGVNE